MTKASGTGPPDNKAQLVKHYLYPSALFASKEPTVVSTVLGTCVSVCLWDPYLKIGGINHYMLPLWNGEELASPKYGNIAIEKLIHAMLKLGANKKHLQAKVFGGKSEHEGKAQFYRIGERNVEIASSILAKENIPILAHSVGGGHGKKLEYYTATGEVYVHLVKPLANQ